MRTVSALRDCGGRLVTDQQAEVLIAVAAHERVFVLGPTTSGLAEMLAVRPRRARQRVDGLARRGLVAIREVGFHRMQQVTLTDRGRAAAIAWCGE